MEAYEKVTYKSAIKHMYRHNVVMSSLLMIIQIIGLVLFFLGLSPTFSVVEIIFLTLMLLTFYCCSGYICISQYKTKLETGKTDPIWVKRYHEMTLIIISAVIVFAVINVT